MIINLTEIPVKFITIDKYPNRRLSMFNMLEYYGFNDVEAIDGVIHSEIESPDPIIFSHLKALDSVDSVPFLVLEDDCIVRDFVPVIEVPDDADIIYLGVSSGSVDTEFTCNGVVVGSIPKYEPAGHGLWKVYSMLCLHAILYTSEYGVTLMKNSLNLAKRADVGADIAVSRGLAYANTYAVESPLWFQHDLPKETNLSLTEAINKSNGAEGGGFPDYPHPITYKIKDN